MIKWDIYPYSCTFYIKSLANSYESNSSTPNLHFIVTGKFDFRILLTQFITTSGVFIKQAPKAPT